VTAHITRCVLNRRSTHNPSLHDSVDTFLPPRRDTSLESPVTLSDTKMPLDSMMNLPSGDGTDLEMEFSHE
jgi:hypothetical protein